MIWPPHNSLLPYPVANRACPYLPTDACEPLEPVSTGDSSECIIDGDAWRIKTEVRENLRMKIGVDERHLVIEALATLANRKVDMVNFLLNPARVPKEIYVPVCNKRNDLTGRRITKRQAAPLILDALDGRQDYTEIVGNIVKIAASWERFELSAGEYEARAVKVKAQEILRRHQQSEAEEVAREHATRQEQEKELLTAKNRELDLLLAMLEELAQQEQNAQKRGFLLQELLNRLFVAFGIPVQQSFTRNEGGEQIDGAFQIDGRFYLTECRWRQRLSDTREVDGLAGQILRSGGQPMGLFLSVSGWSKNVPGLLKQNPHKVIILMHGFDLRTILSEKVDLQDYILASVKNLNLNAEPYLDIRQYLGQRS